MCFCCLSCAFSFQSIGRDNTFRLINANQPARISPLATVVTQTAHQIPSTPMPMPDKQNGERNTHVVAGDADNGRWNGASDTVEYTLCRDLEHHKEL